MDDGISLVEEPLGVNVGATDDWVDQSSVSAAETPERR
jgi:hypothetical protein